MIGHIKSISDKAYGFIRVGKDNDYFFHKNDFNGFWIDLYNDYKLLKIGEKIEVEFEEGYSPKGPCAFNVRRLDWPNQSNAEYHG